MEELTMKFAVRLGFGSEGHGAPIVVAVGSTVAEARQKAEHVLQDQFGGLWASKYADTYIGGIDWLKRNFPLQRGWSKKDLERELSKYIAEVV
jgi:hypothetical protein